MTCSFSTHECFSEELKHKNSGTLLVILAVTVDDENVTIGIKNASGSLLVNTMIKIGFCHGVNFQYLKTSVCLMIFTRELSYKSVSKREKGREKNFKTKLNTTFSTRPTT